ncbi:MAG: NosL family protein [Geobacteraceae bacterium GWB2_52_12]|nr:MAG: NosL family protein [Geobacteraceae bacterium GWB2_52_12]
MRLFLLLLFGFLMTVPTNSLAAAPADISQAPACKQCGMDRGKFNYSRIVIEYEDGSTAGSCSLHCAAVELANSIDKIPVMVRVAEYDSKELIDAETAVWVMGGSKKGVMTGQAKWAFASKAAAERFIAANGGSIVDFDAAIKAAYDDMYQDTKMIREFKRMKRSQLK